MMRFTIQALWVLLVGCDRTGGTCAPHARTCVDQVFHACGDDGRSETLTDCGVEGRVCVEGVGCAACLPGRACEGETAVRCSDEGVETRLDCAAHGRVCHDGECTICRPGDSRCCADDDPTGCQPELEVLTCDDTGEQRTVTASCDATASEVCVEEGGEASCRDACEAASVRRSNIGCEFYAVDLDNYHGPEGSAAAQQFDIALSNPGPLIGHVTVELNEAPPGDPPLLTVIRSLDVGPDQLVALDDLPPREADGSPPGTFGNGTGTAFTSNAYRIASNAPIIAYQFNPLQRFDVFSNDASLLLPSGSVGDAAAPGSTYLVMGWPQLLADTNDPKTDAGTNERSFLAVVGTRAGTHVAIQTRSDVVGSPDIPATPAGGLIEFDLGPFDVLNLEGDGFGSDFTGSTVVSDKPVLVFSGSECGDVPAYSSRSERQCCCDHMEEQLVPTQALGKAFVALQTPLRTVALADAGSDIVALPSEKEYWRLLSAEGGTCTTTLPDPLDQLSLQAGIPRTVETQNDFLVECDEPIAIGQFVASQRTVVGPGNDDEPSGDPTFILVPPAEQYRKEHQFLVPDTYAFDFLIIAARSGAAVWLDDVLIDEFPYCDRLPLGPVGLSGQSVEFDSIKCALSDPHVDSSQPPPLNVDPGEQNDGVHRVRSSAPVGVIVYGFDNFVSYGYAAGTELAAISTE